MRVSLSRRWLVFSLALPAAGVVGLIRAGTGAEERAPRAAGPVAPRGRSEPAVTRRFAGTRSALETPSTSTAAADAAVPGEGKGKGKGKGDELRPLMGKLLEAQESNDERAIVALREQISGAIGRDPAGALAALLADLKGTTDEAETGVILALLVREEKLPQGELLAALLDMARSAELPLHREAAIHALGEARGGDAERVQTLAELGRRDREPEVRETAAVTLGSLGDQLPGPVAQSAAREIVASLMIETEPRVRASLVYALRDTRSAESAGALLAALGDGEATVRLAAADMLGDVAAAHREQAVRTLAERFAREPEPQVRQTIVTSIVRAGRIAAVPVLEKLDGGAAQPLIDDFLAGLRSGEDNMEKLYAVRFARQKARAE